MTSSRTCTSALFVLLSLLLGAMAACDDVDDAQDGDGGSADAMVEDTGDREGRDATSDGATDAGDAGSSDGSGDADAAEVVDAGAPFTLAFRARVGAEDFACGKSYAAVGTPPREVTPVDLRFYVHDVRVVDDLGAVTPIALVKNDWQYQGVALLDFENATGSCADGDAVENHVITGHLPSPVNVRAIKFRLGVPPSLNHRDLSSQPAPLDRSSLFWAWQSGHIFLAAVARVRLPIDGGAGVDAGTAPYNHYTHLGSVGCVGDPAGGVPISSCAKPNRPEITLTGFDPTSKKIVVDFAAIKAGTDLATKGCHADGDQCAVAYEHLGIDWGTGAYLDAQSVFGVE